MLKYLYILSLFTTLMFANTNFSILYKLEKGDKKLGYYKTQLIDNTFSSYSYGASNRLKMFSSKSITDIQDGYKYIEFTKGKQKEKFDVYTKLSSVDKKVQKSFARKFKKVKNNEMLFIKKIGKKGITLFNKRKTIVKTFDEVLFDIYTARVDYNKFILFEKLGIMKMVASIKKENNTYIIRNYSKKKDYMKITIKNNIPISIESLLSNWKANAEVYGSVQMYDIPLKEMAANNLYSQVVEELKGSKIVFTTARKIKSSYDFRGTLSLTLPKSIISMKKYQQKEYLSNLLKKSGIKAKKISLKNSVAIAKLKYKIKTSTLKKEILKNLSKKYPELKMTKDIKFNKNSIAYGVINGQ